MDSGNDRGGAPSTAKQRAIEALAVSASQRRGDTLAKLEAGKAEALRLIKEHRGIYPHNKGRLSQAEVCRLGGFDSALLGQLTHRYTTRPALNKWLESTQRDIVTGKFRRRSEILGRIDEWKAAYEEVLTTFSIVEVELEFAERYIKHLQAQVRSMGGTPVSRADPAKRGTQSS